MALILLLPLLILLGVLMAVLFERAIQTYALATSASTDRVLQFSRSLFANQQTRFLVITVADAFSPEDAVLWRTQMPALELIRAAGKRGLHVDLLRDCFFESAARFPELYDGTDFTSWLNFLEEDHLITLSSSTARITEAGNDFLTFCRATTTSQPIQPAVRGLT